MNRFSQIVPFLCLLLFLLVLNEAKGQVTVTPASGTCLNVAPGAYSAIGNIVIDENNNNDFANQANVTIILTVPAGFQFQVATGAVGYQGGRNISAAAIAVTATTVTVTYSCSGTNRDDRMTISGLFARATIAGASGNILRTAGTGTINGDANGAGINHGTLTASNAGATITSTASGSWTTGSTWVGGVVPGCGASVIILHSVTANAAVSANDLTINTGGILTANNPVTVGGTFTMNGTGSYIHNNVTNVSTTIFAGAESFSTTSSITINQWYNTGFPLPTNVSGNFGNVTFNEGNGWSQDGLFAPAKIKGTLTVSSGQITMDDGTGMTTALTLQDIIINGTGVLRMATGANRNLTLTTGNYTDTRAGGSSYSGVQFNCAGNVTWTANGNVTINPNWSFFEGTGATVGNSNITINGNLNITGGLFDFNRNVDAPLTLLVTGNTTISGSPGWVRFLDRNNKTLTFTTTNFYINSGSANNFNGGSNPTGTSIFNITNDLILTTTSTVATLVNSTPNAAGTTLNVGRDLIVNDGDFRVANSNAPVTVNVTRNLIVNGVNGDFYGQIYPNNTSLSTVNVSGTLQVNNGDYYTSIGQGNISMNITEVIDVNNGRFFGIYNLAAANNGSVSLTVNDIDFDGGTFSLMNATISDGKTVQVNCNNDIFVDFLNTTDVFTFIALAGTNNALLDLNVTNNVTIGGNFAGSYFLSSASSGNETVDIGGNFTINDGDVSFVGNETSLINTHNIVTNITGNLTIAGGVTRLTTGIGTADININGNVTISNGTLNLKYDTGITTMDVAGSYTQSGGTFNLHSRAANTTDPITVTVNGDFAMSDGTLNFDNQVSGGVS
ncbi:MAG: hypothetical protein IPP71_08775 [Bacteroidetes bacterium]|nr:hypothetical protein [Bacteroidota bacterium]